MIAIGVTGGIGAGKSTVAAMFGELGAFVLDADQIAHQYMRSGRAAARKIVAAFGDGILDGDGSISRRKLAAVVFKDPGSRQRLEAILHPRVLRFISQQMQRLHRRREVPAVVLDVPLLAEVGAQRLVDVVVVVTAPLQVRRERLKQEKGWSKEEIDARLAAQWDDAAKAALADYVVDNSSGVDVTRNQVKHIWNSLLETRSK